MAPAEGEQIVVNGAAVQMSSATRRRIMPATAFAGRTARVADEAEDEEATPAATKEARAA